MPTPDRLAYSRLETDVEFLTRLPWKPYTYQKLEGEYLDTCAWDVFKLQRKIVWIPA